ncbi:glycoside hydrolase family 3 protein [Hortaea werneckii]|nr:glycoside hydrolase family 3 protein [Hortaea werneckii]
MYSSSQPLTRSAIACRSRTRTRARRCTTGRDLGHVLGWVLRDRQTTGRRDLAGDDVEHGEATVLARVTTPEQGRDVRVLSNHGVVDLVTHLQHDHGLAVHGELTNDVQLSAGPVDGVTVHAFLSNAEIDTASVDDDIGLLGVIPDSGPVVSSRVALTAWLVVDENVSTGLVGTVDRTVKEPSRAMVWSLPIWRGRRPSFFRRVTPSTAARLLVLTDQRLVERGLIEETLLVGSWKVVLVVGTAVDIGTGIQSSSSGFLTSVGVLSPTAAPWSSPSALGAHRSGAMGLRRSVDRSESLLHKLSMSYPAKCLQVERVLAGRLQTTAPSGILVRVDVWRPVIETGAVEVVEGSSLSRDNFSNGSDQLVVKGGTHDDRLREAGGVAEVACFRKVDTRAVCNTVECLIPPGVSWETQSVDTRGCTAGVVDLFLDRHRIDESGGTLQRV